jgi:nucleotide-binding universal stress UspA family protein
LWHGGHRGEGHEGSGPTRWVVRAEAALPKAVEHVQWSGGGKLVLVRAVEPGTLPPAGTIETRLAAINEAAEYLLSVATRLRHGGVDVVGRSVSYAAAGPAIVEAARTLKPDLIVMASRRAGRLIPGSIADFVLQRTRMPIVLMSSDDAPIEVPSAALKREARMERDRKFEARAGAA